MRLGLFAGCFGLWVAVVAMPLEAAPNPWQRVVIIGASASAGFLLAEPLGGTNTTRCRLNYYLDAAITAPHPAAQNLAASLMFLNPETFAVIQIAAVTNAAPTLVVGADFLFWFCYGRGRNDGERAQRFETGLKYLEEIHCPLVVGDIPDASSATNTGIISPAQVPSEPARRAANQRLHEWATTQPLVTLLPLAQFMHATMANEALRLHRSHLPAGKTRALLQSDRLHPNPQGAAVLALGILDALVVQQTNFPAADICWNPQQVFRVGSDSIP